MRQANVKIGTHGEQYGNWMSNPVFYMFGAGIALAAALTILLFFVFLLPVLGIVFGVILVALAAITCWFAWIRKQYSFTGGGMMGRVHEVLLSHLDFDGKGTLLEVGCGSGALTIRSFLTWPESRWWASTTGVRSITTAKPRQSWWCLAIPRRWWEESENARNEVNYEGRLYRRRRRIPGILV